MVLKYTNKTNLNIIASIRSSMYCVRELSGQPSYILLGRDKKKHNFK